MYDGMTPPWSSIHRYVCICLLASMMLLVITMLDGSVEAYDPEDPATWNWTIAGDIVTYCNATVLLDENITVKAGGSLHLVNVTVTFNVSYDVIEGHVYGILVEDGGELIVDDWDKDPSTQSDASVIRNWRDYESFTFLCEEGSKLLIRNSIVRNCFYSPGFLIRTDDATILSSICTFNRINVNGENAFLTMKDTTTYYAGEAVNILGGSANITGCHFLNGDRANIYVSDSRSVSISNSTFKDNHSGAIYAENSSISITDCSMTNLSYSGIFFRDNVTSVISGCTIEGPQWGIYCYYSSKVEVEDCDISSTDFGIWSYFTKELSITRTILKNGNSTAVHCNNTSPIITDCSIRGWAHGLVLENSTNFLVERCSFEGNLGTAVRLANETSNGSHGIIRDCTFRSNTRSGIWLEGDSTCLVSNGTFADNGWYGIQCEEDATLDWDIKTDTLVVNETLWIRGFVTIDTGGNLTLVNTSMIFAEHMTGGWGDVTISGGEMWVLDGSPDVNGDGSEVTVDLDNQGELGDLRLWVRDGGRINAARSFFLAAQVRVVDGAFNALECQFSKSNTSVNATEGIGGHAVVGLVECTFTDGVQGVVADEASVSVVGCSFLRMAEAVNLTRCRDVFINDTTVISTEVGVRLSSTVDVWVQNCTLRFCKDAVWVKKSLNTIVNNSTIDSSLSHGIRAFDFTVYVFSSTISRCRAGGTVVDVGTLWMSNCSISNNERVGIWGNRTYLTMVGTSVTGTDGIGVWNSYNMTGGEPLDMYLMRDCFLQGSTAYDLRLEGRFIARVYNTRIEPEDTRVYDEVQLEVYNPYSLEVRVMGVQPVPPPPVDYTLIDPFGKVTGLGTFPNGTNELAALWALAWTMNATDTTVHTPYKATVTVVGRDWTGDVELGFGKKSVIVVDLELLPKMSTPETIVEGEDVLLDASNSVGYPFGIAHWTWELGDGTVMEGPKVTVRFPGDGEQRIRLTIEDTVGNNKTVSFKLTVQDAVPEAHILPGTPDTVDEDQVLTLEGRYVAQVDDVIVQEWDFGDGNTATGSSATHAYKKAGSYNITFTVLEEDGSYAEDVLVVTVVNVAPTAIIKEVELEVGKRERFDLDGSLSTDTPSDRGTLSYMWDMGGDPFLTGAQAFWRFEEVGVYTINLMVVDDDGDWDRTSMTVTVVNRPPTIGPIPDARLNATDPVWSHKLEVSDPDDDLRNLTLSFPEFEPGGAFSAWVERDDDGGWTVYVRPTEERDGSRADVEVTVRDPDGGTASTTFTIDIDTSMVEYEIMTMWWVVLVMVLILAVLSVGYMLHVRRTQRPPQPPEDGA